MSQTSSSSPRSGDLGGNCCQGCWCSANLDEPGFDSCTWHSDWEEFAALPPGMVLYFHLILVLSRFLWIYIGYRVRVLCWHFIMWTCWIRLLVDCGQYLSLVVFSTFWLWSIFVSSMLLWLFNVQAIFYETLFVAIHLLIFQLLSGQVFFLACPFLYCMTSTRTKLTTDCVLYMGIFRLGIKKFTVLF